MESKLVTMTKKAILEEILQFDNIEDVKNKKQIIFKIVPELKDEEEFDQKNPWHIYDVWEHTLVALRKSKPDLEIRLAVLLHDIGKPHCYQDDGNIRHFKGHSEKSAQIAKEILERLGYKENQVKDICFLIENHSKTINIEEVNKDNLQIMKKLLHIQYCDAYAYNPEYTNQVTQKLDKIYRKLKSIEDRER